MLTGLGFDEQKCVAAMAKNFGKVAKAQNRDNSGCLKDAGKDARGGVSADECLGADRKGKVQKAGLKTASDMSKRCLGVINVVGDAPFSAAGINAAAEQEAVDWFLDAFGDRAVACAIRSRSVAFRRACGWTMPFRAVSRPMDSLWPAVCKGVSGVAPAWA